MKYEVVLTQDANQDINETFHWYESQSIGLSKNFLAQVDNSLKIIQDNHKLFLVKYKNVRRCLIKRFPYKIFYTVNKNQIIILAVIFGGRDPNWIKKRLLKK
ncbi:MAG: hypothetical protein A2068_08205 [Ignavibacteria bacterium GWB2_35_6b]|nr:MAG: hypothetical protein A2068_08205 [Ignavibacteria bacterium GWB2_35_6b]